MPPDDVVVGKQQWSAPSMLVCDVAQRIIGKLTQVPRPIGHRCWVLREQTAMRCANQHPQ